MDSAKNCDYRCPKCGMPTRPERSHMRCEFCGIIEACCEGGPTDIPGIDFSEGAAFMAATTPKRNFVNLNQGY